MRWVYDDSIFPTPGIFQETFEVLKFKYYVEELLFELTNKYLDLF